MSRSVAGSILGNFAAGVLVLGTLAASVSVFSSLSKSRQWSQSNVEGHEMLALKLDELINLPSSSTELAATTTTPHTDGAFQWEIQDISPRLKKIQLRMTVKNSAASSVSTRTIGQLGYRYDDF